MTEEQIRHLVGRFLFWKLPTNFSPDNGIMFSPMVNQHTQFPSRREPQGTNLLDAGQATEMVRFMLEGLPE